VQEQVTGFMNSSREIQREEFSELMALMRSYNRQGAGRRDGRLAGLKVGKYVENGGLLGYFFMIELSFEISFILLQLPLKF